LNKNYNKFETVGMDKARFGSGQSAAMLDPLQPEDVKPELHIFGEGASGYLASGAGRKEGWIAWSAVCHGTFPFEGGVAKPTLNKGQIVLYFG
jgi:hypothetical protein